MDRVTIDGFTVYGAHGYFDHERTREQEFEVSVSLGTDLRRAGQSDSLTDTIDYDLVRRTIEEVFASESRYLVESLAEEIVRRLFVATPVREVTISIRKKAIWDNGVPGVAITRRRL